MKRLEKIELKLFWFRTKTVPKYSETLKIKNITTLSKTLSNLSL